MIVNSVPPTGDLFQGPLSKSIMNCLDKKDQKVVKDQLKSEAPIGPFKFVTSDAGGRWLAIYHCCLGKWDGEQGAAAQVNLYQFIASCAMTFFLGLFITASRYQLSVLDNCLSFLIHEPAM